MSDEVLSRQWMDDWRRLTAEGDVDGLLPSLPTMSSSGRWQLARDANLTAGAGHPDRV